MACDAIRPGHQPLGGMIYVRYVKAEGRIMGNDRRASDCAAASAWEAEEDEDGQSGDDAGRANN